MKPLFTEVAMAFHQYQQDMMKVMTRYKSMSAEQEEAARVTNQGMFDKLMEIGLAEHIDWS